MVFETLAFSLFNHLTQLIARENFIISKNMTHMNDVAKFTILSHIFTCIAFSAVQLSLKYDMHSVSSCRNFRKRVCVISGEIQYFVAQFLANHPPKSVILVDSASYHNWKEEKLLTKSWRKEDTVRNVLVDHVNSVQCKYERKEGIQFNFLHSTSD
jgi:hypothetical protein